MWKHAELRLLPDPSASLSDATLFASGQARMEAPQRGVVFDNYYTDSLLRALAGRAQIPRTIRTRKALPRREVLADLLLFGHAHLTHPYWLSSPEPPQLGTLEREGLISWIPTSYYSAGLDFIRSFRDCLQKIFGWRAFGSSFSLDVARDAYGEINPSKWLRDSERPGLEIESGLDMLSFHIDQLELFEPLFASGLSHAKIDRQSAEWLFRRPTFSPSGSLEWSASPGHHVLGPVFVPVLDGYMDPDLGPSFTRHAHEGISRRFFLDLVDRGWLDLGDEKAGKLLASIAATLDVMLSMLVIERFAGDTKNPVKVNAVHSEPTSEKVTVKGPYAYQLVQVQFENLKYPVIETVEDVLRLREDPNLDNYREVIFSYSRDMQTALESERFQVLQRFRIDLERSLADVARAHRWSVYLDLTFYLSVPLAIAGFLTGLPLSDILTIPIGGAAKLASLRRRRKAGWLMFACPKPGALTAARRRRRT